MLKVRIDNIVAGVGTIASPRISIKMTNEGSFRIDGRVPEGPLAQHTLQEDYSWRAAHLLAAAFRAISVRRSGCVFDALAFPPLRPIPAAALDNFSRSSAISPVAFLANHDSAANGVDWPLLAA